MAITYKGFSTVGRNQKFRLTDFDLVKQDLINHFNIRKGEKLMNPNFGTVIPAGADLLNIPEKQFSMQLAQETRLAGKSLTLIGGLVYVDERNGFFSNQDFKLPSYTTVQVAANYEVTSSIELRAEINNLFDREYYTNSFADVWVQPGAPRNAHVSATFRY